MEIFESEIRIAEPRERVFEWFTRPGALIRLWPPFGGRVVQEPSDGINVGSQLAVAVTLPGTPGLFAEAAASMLPVALRPEVNWIAEHVELELGRQFVDEMTSGPLKSWRHVHDFVECGDGTLMEDHVSYELPVPLNNRLGLRLIRTELERIFSYRERQLAADLAFHSTMPSRPLTVAITGASGLIGSQVAALLGGGGHRVLKVVRRPSRSDDEISWDPETGHLDAAGLAQCDVVIHLAGHPIGGRFTARNKHLILESRRRGTALIAKALANLAADGRRRALISASAIGYYGAQAHRAERTTGAPTEPLTEDSPSGDDFLATVCRAWEDACRPAARAGVRVVNVRTGLVLSPAGGLLTRFLPLYLAGVGGPLGRHEWQSWIGIDDMASIYAFAALTSRVEGPINAVAPMPVTAAKFAATLGKVLRRPSRMAVPPLGPRLLLGAEGARELARADQRVSSSKLESLGYRFRHRDLETQLRHVLGFAGSAFSFNRVG